MARRPNLGALAGKLERKPSATAEAAPVEAAAIGEATDDAPKGRRLDGRPRQRRKAGEGEKGDPRKAALVRLDPAEWRALKIMALDDERPLQSLLEDAVRDYLRKRGAV